MGESQVENNLKYKLALCRVKGLNPTDHKKLVENFPSAEEVFRSSRNRIIKILEPRRNVAAVAEAILRFDSFDEVEKEIEEVYKCGGYLIAYDDSNYPPALKKIPDPPIVLQVKGTIEADDALSIAVVGTRRATPYGRATAANLARELARCGVCVVSGLARGIDSEAHTGAISANGRTIAVLGTGLDVTYPPENRKLRERIERHGAVITEYPPGAGPEPWRFPARNRIISGMTLGCVVVEAPPKSGALITANLALEYNREVFAVPGNINSSKSRGCNNLIKEGAKPVTCVDDILEEFDIDKTAALSQSKTRKITQDEKKILQSISPEGTILEDIIQATGMQSFVVNSALLQMELRGLVRKMPGNVYMSQVEIGDV